MPKRTALYETHIAAGARVIEFGGWDMPVQYSGIVDEHHTVRNAVGIFDISHMGEVFVRGTAATAFLNKVLTNDASVLGVGQGQYSLMCQSNGGVIDDLYVFRVAAEEFLLIINASRIDADLQWLNSCWVGFEARDRVEVQNQSDVLSAVAVQGPNAVRFIDACCDAGSWGGKRPSELVKNEILRAAFESQPVYISRTGYTGEDGFELVAPNALIAGLWRRCLEAGAAHGIKPAGLGARDTLRTEACYPLYGHELNDTVTPVEAGLSFFVNFNKGEFNGRAVLWQQKTEGASRKSVAFRMTEKSAPPRQLYRVLDEQGNPVGEVTSGTQSPTLSAGVGMALVPPSLSAPGTRLSIEIRGKSYPAVTCRKPLYKRTVS